MDFDLRVILSALGFVQGTGFNGEVWTNPDDEWMTQVWACLKGKMDNNNRWYDARGHFDLADFADFYKWLGSVSAKDHYSSEAFER